MTVMIEPVTSHTMGDDILTSADVGKLIVSDQNPEGVTARTIGIYRRLSKAGGRYATLPFPEPAGFHGDRPYWKPEQIDDIKRWAEARPRHGIGGRPRSTS